MKKTFSFTFFIVFTFLAFSQNNPAGKTLTLNEAVKIALENNSIVRQAQNYVERDQASVMAAYGNFLPSASMSASWGGSKGESFIPEFGSFPSTTSRSLSTSIGTNVTLFDGFSNTSTLDAAIANAQSTESSLARVRQTIVKETQRRYYEVLRTEKLMKVSESNLQYSKQQLERVNETARLGSASIVNVYQQQAQVGQDELRYVQAQSEYELARANLIAYLAAKGYENLPIGDPSIPEEIDLGEMKKYEESIKNFEMLVGSALEKRPDYMSAQYTFSAAESHVVSAQSGYFPRVSASAGYSWRGSYSSLSRSPNSPSNEFSDFGNSRSLSWGLSFSFPIFSGWQTDNQVQSAVVARKNAEENLRENARQIGVDVRTSILQLQAAMKNYEAAIKNLEFQDKNLKVNQERFKIGAGTMLDLLYAENNYKSALTSKINAVYQYLNTKSQLEYAMGTIQY